MQNVMNWGRKLNNEYHADGDAKLWLGDRTSQTKNSVQFGEYKKQMIKNGISITVMVGNKK